MSITSIMVVLSVIGVSLNTIILLGSIFQPRKSSKSDSKPQHKELNRVTLTVEDSKGKVIKKKQADINESDADELLRNIQSYSH